MQPEMDRVMEFYETARVDGLIKREETPKTMTEYYQGRSDFLSYRHVDFGDRVKKLALNSAESNPRPMVVSSCWAWGQGAHSVQQAKVTLGWGKQHLSQGPCPVLQSQCCLMSDCALHHWPENVFFPYYYNKSTLRRVSLRY